MTRLILFRFHTKPAVCRERLSVIRGYNPGITICGLYGGDARRHHIIQEYLTDLDHVYTIRGKTPDWKWRNGDLAVSEWYRDVGIRFEFDMCHLIEWDLLLFGSVESLYSHVCRDGLGLTGLIPLAAVEDRWGWTVHEPGKTQWQKLLTVARSRYGYVQEPFASLGPGICYPREFLEEYSQLDVPELLHDELRVPLFAQIMGLNLYDTGFLKDWIDPREKKYFNCGNLDIATETIVAELANPNGRRAFHPFRTKWLGCAATQV